MAWHSDNYTATELVRRLHGLQHYDISLGKVGNTFVYSTTDFTYPETLAASFALPWLVFGLVAVISAIVAGGCDKRRQNQNRYLRLNSRRASLACPTGVLITMLVVMLLSGPASFIANKAVSQGVGTVTDHLTAGQGVVDRIVKDASDTNVAIKAVDLDQVTMPSDTKAQLQRSLNAASSELNDVLRIQSSISIGRAPHVITAYDTFRTQMTMLFMGILLLVGLMGVGCGRFGSDCGTTTAWILAAIWCFMGCIVGGAFCAAMVGVADFCADPNAAAANITQQDTTVDVTGIAEYYIFCAENTTFAYLSDVDRSLGYISSSIGVVEGLSHTPSLTALLIELRDLNNTATKLAGEVTCSNLHHEFAGAIGGLCGDAIDGLFMLVGTIGALSVALAISACMIRKVQHKKAANEAIDDLFLDDDDEYELEFSTSAHPHLDRFVGTGSIQNHRLPAQQRQRQRQQHRSDPPARPIGSVDVPPSLAPPPYSKHLDTRGSYAPSARVLDENAAALSSM